MDEAVMEPAPTGAGRPRLVIREMVLENFKSYAGVQRVGPFHKSFSSVVGPNGSGKSNVIDALLFVFGKRAKQLRLNKVSELIHNSAGREALTCARVSVHFHEIVDSEDDPEGFTVVAGSELVVSREATAANTSKYALNGRAATFADVARVFAAKGVDLDNNRFLILQGEVEQISMMKPKSSGPNDEGLLEYLEEIVGSCQYVARIEEGAKKLEELNEQRLALVHRLKHVEKERAGLEGAKAEAEAHQAKERALLRDRCALYQVFAADAAAAAAGVAASTAALEARLAAERASHGAYAARLVGAEAAFGAARGEHGALVAELERAKEEFKEFERKDIKAREELKFARAKAKKADEKAASDAARRAELEAKAAALTSELPALAAAAAAAEAQLVSEEAKVGTLLEGLRDELAGLGEQLAGVEAQLAPWEARASAAQGRADVARAERDLLASKAGQAARRAERARRECGEAEAGAVREGAAASAASADAAAAAAAGAAARAQEADARAAEAAARAEGAGARGRMEERRAACAAARSQGAALAALLAARASGAIPGLLGRLGDLGSVGPEHDVAASTAGGAALDQVVVETTGDALAGVALLRARNLGTATFLILDKQRPEAVAAAAAPPPAAGQLPPGARRLLDLVTPAEPRLRVAFYAALRHTLVAADLDAASAVAQGPGRPRVVTLHGELIEPSGTLSGGGGRPKGGRLRVAGSGGARGAAPPPPSAVTDAATAEADLAAATAAWEAAAGRAEGARLAAEEAGGRAARAEAAAASASLRRDKAALAAASLTATAADLRGTLAALDAAAGARDAGDDARAAELRTELDDAVAQLAAASAGAAGLHARAKQLRAARDEAGGMRLRAARGAVARLRGEIDAAGEAAATRRANAAAATKAAAKLAAAAAEAAAERSAAAADLAARRAGLKALEDKALAVNGHYAATQALASAAAARLAGLKTEHEEAKKGVAIIRGVELEIGAKLEDLGREAAAAADKVRSFDRKLLAARRERAEAEGAAAGQLAQLLGADEAAAVDRDDVFQRVALLEAELASSRPDAAAIAAWAAKEEEYGRRAGELGACTAQRDAARSQHDALRKRRLDDFMAGFNAISLKLKEMYQMITLGGDAELELVDSLDPFSDGIVFSVRPPKKSWKNIANLSGGEKTLSSLALVFALHHYKPTPLYVMDEIDAALDFKNVSIVAHYIKERTRDAQFVIISLRNNMFELADRLVGVYKTENATKTVTINPAAFAVEAVGA